ncbi:MAG: rRNA maturation RNase YbeY [Pseudohongiellaceae bacterium]
MNVTIDLQNASGSKQVPLRRQFKHWAMAALQQIEPGGRGGALSIRLVDEAESAGLNGQYRNRHYATNILSFPVPAELGSRLLGDLAICAPVVEREAHEQDKSSDEHWAHLVVHGVLHLKGYDHEDDAEAERMEALEVRILQQLGVKNPYQPIHEN